MDASRPVVAEAAAAVDSVATQIWLWGQGRRPQLPDFTNRFGVGGRLTSAVDLVRGLGVLAGIEVLDVPGATAGFDNDYVAQRVACIDSLADRDFFLLHVEATDEAGHQQDAGEKVASLEAWDREIIGPLLEALPAFGAVPDPPAAGPRDPRRARHPHLRAGALSAPRQRVGGGRAAPTPSRPRPTARRWPPTASWPGWSRPPDFAPMMPSGATPPDPQRSGSSLG